MHTMTFFLWTTTNGLVMFLKSYKVYGGFGFRIPEKLRADECPCYWLLIDRQTERERDVKLEMWPGVCHGNVSSEIGGR